MSQLTDPFYRQSITPEATGLGATDVIGTPHEVYGEVPAAYVVTYPDAAVTADELLALCRGNLTKIKIPVAINIVRALPKNPVGKIDKPALRAARS